MGSVVTYDEGDKFMIRHFCDLGSSQGPVWSNTVEAYAEGPGALADLKTLAGKVLAVYQAMSSNEVRFTRYTISTWEAEGVPYNPEHFYAEDLADETGLRTITNLLDLGVCLVIGRNASVGRTGRLWLRGALGEADVEIEGGKFILTDPTTFASTLSGAITSSTLGYHFVGGMADLKLAMLGYRLVLNTPQYWQSLVTGLAVKGVSLLPTKHKWYNHQS